MLFVSAWTVRLGSRLARVQSLPDRILCQQCLLSALFGSSRIEVLVCRSGSRSAICASRASTTIWTANLAASHARSASKAHSSVCKSAPTARELCFNRSLERNRLTSSRQSPCLHRPGLYADKNGTATCSYCPVGRSAINGQLSGSTVRTRPMRLCS